ncbi:unnamed protein product [Phytophthora fragariaefolia]|uniref:ATP-dependent DNA helicase n=1 Tax=Phytophthora fragariaefolia TaxID=1490495 RepID=A0A9W6Y4I0_9STRA|nr:unnamed protein product [Phytophthora fragariaefolia]
MIVFHTLKRLNDLLQISGQAVAGFDLPQLSDPPHCFSTRYWKTTGSAKNSKGTTITYYKPWMTTRTSSTKVTKRYTTWFWVQYIICNLRRICFFIDGPGGTGKSTLLKHILASVRLSGKIAIAVASGGIAVLLRMGGRTAHSTLKISLKLDEKLVCSIHKQSKLKKLFQEASLIIWDEAPMTHRHAFEAVDRSFRDVLNNDEDPFGGKTVVLSGDCRQIIPDVVRGTPAQTIDACLKLSHLWSHSSQVHLTENMLMRAAHIAETAAELAAFPEVLLQAGEGRHEVSRQLGRDYMKLPRSMLIDGPPEEEVDEDEVIAPGAILSGLKRLIDVMYPDVNNQAIATDEYFANRTILTTTNITGHRITDAVAASLDGDDHEYRSIDKLQDDDDWNFFEPKIMNSVNINGIPPLKLTLKKGARIMLMRNFSVTVIVRVITSGSSYANRSGYFHLLLVVAVVVITIIPAQPHPLSFWFSGAPSTRRVARRPSCSGRCTGGSAGRTSLACGSRHRHPLSSSVLRVRVTKRSPV